MKTQYTFEIPQSVLTAKQGPTIEDFNPLADYLAARPQPDPRVASVPTVKKGK